MPTRYDADGPPWVDPGEARNGTPTSWTFSAFGLEVTSELQVIGAEPGSSGPPVRPMRMCPSTDETSVAERPITDADTLIIERRKHTGELVMRVRHLEDGRYTVEAPNHGSFSVTPDGSTIFYECLQEPAWIWHRPLFAQALPVAAALQGLELFHASAVELDGRAVGFIADSGTGKSSLATHLNVRGAPLLTDDVLSLECHDEKVIAHPGVRLANIADEQLGLLTATERRHLGVAVGTSDKVHVVISNMASQAVPVGALCFLERSPDTRRLELERAEPPDPWRLLGATFTPHVLAASRLTRQLDLCAEIAARVPLFQLRAPIGLSARDLAAAVERRLGEEL